MRLVTWNVWFGAHEFRARATALVRELELRRPDVVALQEVTAPLRAILDDELAGGYTLYGGNSPFGYDVMILTRIGVRRVDTLELPSQMGRRLLAVELASGLTVATVHLESTAPCVPERVAQLERIGPWLAARGEACLVGDMNFDDFAATESDVLPESFVDVWPTLRREPGFTVDSLRNGMRSDLRGKVQKRIDRVFLHGARWRARAIELVGTEAIDADDTYVSDHFGLAVELDDPPT